MEKTLENFLTEEEKKKMDQIISQAMKRREESGEAADGMMPLEFVVISLQCQKDETEQEKIHHMLIEMCKYCRQFWCCVREDEELPF